MATGSFASYFLREVHRLTQTETTSIRKLCSYVLDGQPEATASLFLYAVGKGRVELLLRRAAGTRLEGEFEQMAALVDGKTEDQILRSAESYPPSYQVAIKGYLEHLDRPMAEAQLKDEYRDGINRLLERTKISCRQACREVGLNQGNVWAWLRTGDGRKVSLDGARLLFDHLTAKATEMGVFDQTQLDLDDIPVREPSS